MITVTLVVGPRFFEYKIDDSQYRNGLSDESIRDMITSYKTLQANPPGVDSTEWNVVVSQIEAFRIEREDD